MKKFLSLLCATMLVFSASAAPVAKKAEIAKKAVAVEQVQKVQFEQAQIANFDQLSATPAVKVNNFKPQTLAKAPQASQAEPIVVIIKGTPSIQPAGGVQAITVIGKDNMVYAWGVKATSLEAGKTYAFTDMDIDYTYRCSQDYMTTWEDPTDATFSIDAEKNITASIVTESGTYMVYTNDPTPVTPTLAEKYNATGKVSTDGGNTWNDAPAWVATTGADKYGPTITNLIPKGPFQNAIALNYEFVGNQIVIPTTPLAQADAENLVFVLDITNWMNGGSGAIVLDVAEDGSISLPAANANHIIGYMKAKFNTSTYAPTEMTGVYQIYGNLAYSIAKPITERDTVDIVSTALKYNDLIASNKVVIYYAADVEGYYLFRVTSNNATSVDGTFKWSDGTINDPNSYFSVSGTDKNYFQDGEFTVVTNNKDIALTGWMIGEDEKYYRLDMSYTAPTERDTLKFSGQGVTISECTDSQSGVQTGWFYQLADASTGYEFLLQSTVVAEQYGTFSYANKTLGSNYYNVFDPQGNRQQFVEGSITVSNDGSEIVLDGELIAEDEKVYVLHFTQSAKVLNYDTDAPFDATFAYSDMSADLDEGVIGIYATNAEGLTIGLELYADPAATKIPAGVYTISDSEEAGTALQSLGVAGGYLTECYAGTKGASGIKDCWFMVEGTITLSYDEYGKLKVVVDAKNSYGQPVTALVQYVKLEPKKTVDFTDAEVYVYEGYVEKYGIMNFYGGNADGYEFDLYAYADTIAGDFLEAIDFGDCELTSPAGSIGIIDAYEFKVERDGKNLTLTAKVLGSDTVQYNITATGYYGYIQGDAVEGYVGEFAVEEVAIQEVTVSKVKYIYIAGTNAAGDQLALVVKGELEDGAIAAGTYNEVMACTGFDAQGQLNPSYVGNNTGVWFIQGGELVVNENGAMAFAGVNSYDAPVAIGFTVPTPEVTDYYLVGWINNAAYGIEGDIDNFGDYHFVDGKVKATFDVLSYVQVKDNNKQIYGTDTYVAPVDNGSATLLSTGTEKVAINGGVEYEYTLVVNEDGTLTLSYAVVTSGLNNTKANVKAAKQIKNGQIVIVRENKEYNILGAAL